MAKKDKENYTLFPSITLYTKIFYEFFLNTNKSLNDAGN